MAVRENKDYYGEPFQYDPNFRGPLARRSCTDVIFLFIFIVFIGCFLGMAAFAARNGDVKSLLAPTDSKGRKCGIDQDVIDKPYLMFFDLTQCVNKLPLIECRTPQVCVSSCPTKSFLWDAAQQNRLYNPKELICQDGRQPRNALEARNMIENNYCARYYLASTPVHFRCLPLPNINSNSYRLGDNAMEVNVQEVNNGKRVVKLLNDAKETATKIVNDIYDSWVELIIYTLVSLVVSLLIIFLLRWFAGLMTWASIFAILALFAYGIYFFTMKYINFKETTVSENFIIETARSNLDTKTTWLVLDIIAAIVLAILLLLIIFLRKRIMLAIEIFKETSKSVLTNCSALFFPIIPWSLQVAVFGLVIYIGLNLASIDQGEHRISVKPNSPVCLCSGAAASYTNGSFCNHKIFDKNCRENGNPCIYTSCELVKEDTLITYLHVFNVFGFFWLTFFIGDLANMILAGIFATWYWTFDKSSLPCCGIVDSLGTTLRYHLGTLAFGSLILTICRMIRIALEYISKKLSLYDNCFVKAILCCLKCFFWCLENFIKFMNKNAYIMCAIHGKNFCSSAKDAFNLLMRNVVRVVVISRVTSFLVFINKLVIVGSVVALAYWMSFREEVNNSLNYNWIPVALVGLVAYIIASIFFSVFVMGVSTLFLCFLEDSERNDGSLERPYYMSTSLMKILGKKNKQI